MRTKIEQKGLDLYNALREPLSKMETMEEMDNFKIELGTNKEVIAECMKCAQINIESGKLMKRAGIDMNWEAINHYNNLIIEACNNAVNKGDKEMKKNMNGHEKIAAKNIKGAFNWLVGGWYNCMQDGYEEDIPTLEEAKEAVCDEAMNNLYRGGGEACGKAPKEMRFAGEEFCRAYVEELFQKDEDVEEIWGNEATKENKEDNEMESKREMLNNMTVKELRAEANAQGIERMSRAKKDELIEALMNNGENTGNTIQISKVNMYAFTGMFIGEFEAEVQDGKIMVNTTSKGELMFDLKTGKEIADKNKSRYANRVEAV